jgi:hypothetical protein
MKIFISYAREDEVAARRLHLFLRSIGGVYPWMDKEDILPGAVWEDEIEAAVTSSDVVILLLSSRLVSKTGFIQREVRLALSRLAEMPPGRIFLIPARLDQTEPTHRELRKLQWVDLFPDWSDGAERIRAAVNVTIRARQPELSAPPNTRVAGKWKTQGTAEFTFWFADGRLHVSGIDTSDGELFEVVDSTWDGETLTLTTTMPSTKWTTVAALKMAGPDRMIGTLENPERSGLHDEWTRLA